MTVTSLGKGNNLAYLYNLQLLRFKPKFHLIVCINCEIRKGWGKGEEPKTSNFLLLWAENKTAFTPAATINHSAMHLATPSH